MSSEKLQQNGSSQSSPPPPAAKSRTVWDRFPPWISSNLRSWKPWKVLLRSWVVAWMSIVIMLPNKSLQTLGNTAFFALLLSLILPPYIPAQIYIIAATSVIIGIGVGWALSCAAMAAALAARDQTFLQQALQKQAQSTAGLANPEALFVEAIFKGDFLDSRSSVIFGVFLSFGCFMFALVRAYAPKLTLMSVFGTIAIDIFCTVGPLFPFAQYTILDSMMTSVACYMALSLVFYVFFPETMNHSYLNAYADLLEKFKSTLALQNEVLQSQIDDVLPGTPLSTKANMARMGMVQHIQQLISEKGMLNLEIVWGRWNGDDVLNMLDPLQVVVTRLAALNMFAKVIGHPASAASEVDSDSDTGTMSSSIIVGDTYLFRQFRERNEAAEAEHNVRLIDTLPRIHEATSDLRQAATSVLDALKALVISINTKRYGRAYKEQDARLVELETAVSGLRVALEDFKTDRRLLLLKPFQSFFERADGGVLKNVPLRSLYVSYVFASNLTSACNGILCLAENISATAMKRQKARLWMPKGLRTIFKFIRSRSGVGEAAAGEDAQPEDNMEAEHSKKYKLDPDSRPPKNTVQRVANVIHKGYRWTKTPEALFTFRYVLLTIALWLPSVFRTSARFAYAERSIWATIMAQTTLNIYASDQIFNYVMRIGGTFVGAVLGMLCWYIGSGNGNGSPYGFAASSAVCLFPLVFCRLYAPPQYVLAVIMAGVTFTLVVGYSWLDGNLPGVVSNVGLGWEVAWRRYVLVMVGSAASFIVMMFPPKSGRKAVRLRNASIISALSYLYSHLTALWLGGEDPFESAAQKGESGRTLWPRDLRQKFISLAEQIQDLRVQTAMSKWEGNIRGAWASDDYGRLMEVENDMLGNLVLMAGALAGMDPEFRKAALPHTIVLNPHFISDVVSMFSLIAHSLRTAEPLHEAQYKNLSDRLHYHHTYGNASRAIEEMDLQVRWETITSWDYMFYATAVVGVLQMTHSLNELRTLVADLCGELPLEGFEQWREEYDRHHVPV